MRFAASDLEKRNQGRSIPPPNRSRETKQVLNNYARRMAVYRGHRYEPQRSISSLVRRSNSFPRVRSPLFGFISPVKMLRVRLYSRCSHIAPRLQPPNSIDSYFSSSIVEDFNKISNTAWISLEDTLDTLSS